MGGWGCRIETAGLWSSLKSVDADNVNLVLLEFLVLNWLLSTLYSSVLSGPLSVLASISMDILKLERLERPSGFVLSSGKLQ